ncbi:MAG: hypothetical protein IIB40_10605, partial [Candidatus Marinimicrobia bacterium]|nr:hypothetical protein [Candidatus Neomarinimicrobiota bacterium]
MQKTVVTIPMLVIVISLMTGGCDSSSEPAETTGTFNVRITDAPASFDAVNI